MTDEKVEETPAVEPATTEAPAPAEAEAKEVDIDIKEDLAKVDVAKLENATKLAKEIDEAMKKSEKDMTRDDVNLLADKLAGFVVAIRESMIFWPIATMWKLTPDFLKKIGAGTGLIGWTLNKIPGPPQMLTDMTQGMLEAGLLDSPEGLNPAKFSENAVLLIKVLKWSLPVIGLVFKQVLPLVPFMPALEKLATGKGELLQQVRNQVAEKLKPVEAEQAEAHNEAGGVATAAVQPTAPKPTID